MTDDNVIEFPPSQAGYYCLADLPQSAPVDEIALSTGWWELDQIWRPYPGQFTVVTGIAGHGKSTFMLNVLCNMARKHGTRSFMYVPENEVLLRDKLKPIWGEHQGWPYFIKHQCYVQSARTDRYDEPAHTITWVLDQAVRAVEQDKCDIILIDPWNELEHIKPRDLSMTDYIRECLMYLKQFTRCMRVAVILIAHPTKAGIADKKIPTLADIEGSLAWYNKCDNGLIVSRDMETGTSKVISAKVRELGSGKIGTCHFHVDPLTGRFTPQAGAVG